MNEGGAVRIDICSFCGRGTTELRTLLLGASANICDECLSRGYWSVQEEGGGRGVVRGFRLWAGSRKRASLVAWHAIPPACVSAWLVSASGVLGYSALAAGAVAIAVTLVLIVLRVVLGVDTRAARAVALSTWIVAGGLVGAKLGGVLSVLLLSMVAGLICIVFHAREAAAE